MYGVRVIEEVAQVTGTCATRFFPMVLPSEKLSALSSLSLLTCDRISMVDDDHLHEIRGRFEFKS